MGSKFLEGIRPNVLALGAASFFNDVSSEMILPILPVFLTAVMGVGPSIVGLIEGVADSASSLLDIFVGYWSDLGGRRKRFVLAGYGLSSLSKFGIALSGSWPLILLFRGADRLGKSVRTAPRDALIAASSDKSVRGKAFGLHRAMDTLGAVAGPILAYLILSAMGSTADGYRAVFLAASLPAFLVLAVIFLFVKEPKKESTIKGGPGRPKRASDPKGIHPAPRPNFWASLRALPSDYRRFVLISCLFSLSYFSFALLIVRASEIGIPSTSILLVYILYNIVYAAASVPIGQLSDRIGRKRVIVGSFLLYALVLAGFAYVSTLWQLALLFALYGLFVAADDSVSKAYLSDISTDRTRGMALGAYNSAVGAAYLPASVLAGAAWAAFGALPTFLAAAAVAAFSGLAMAAYAK
ncbi:MAG: MFS transporter [Candidatus Micrarchaeota archaeon]